MFTNEENGLIIQLKPIWRGEDVEALIEEFLAARFNSLSVNAQAVERFDTPCLEVLLATKKQWLEDGVSMRITTASEQFSCLISLLGFQLTDFDTGGH